MSNYRINAAREVLAGMEERYANSLRPMPDAVRRDIEKRQREIDRMEAEHARENGNRQCHCRAHEHGGDCMCFE